MQHNESSTPIYNLTPDHFLSMLKMGAASVLAKETFINQINYFPVSDHDTGSNLAALMRYISSTSYTTTHLSQLLKQVADASLIGACGNSGMILSAFFIGFAAPSHELAENHFTTNHFAQCIEQGVKEATKAVMEPVEGTILSVMNAWSKALNEIARQCNDFILLFEKSVSVAHDALEKTRYELRANKQQQVVDAGAFGFVQFILGMQKQLLNKTSIASFHVDEIKTIHKNDHKHDEFPNYQYCFEVLLKTQQISPQLKAFLQSYGDSLVINQSPSYVKIHIHTNQAITLSEDLKKYGIICHQKIDDMQKQWRIVNQRKHDIALVTDTAADIPVDWITKHQIHLLPVQIRIGQHTYLDNISINLNKLYQSLHGENLSATTSPPSPESVKRYLHFLASNYQSIIIITTSSKLSSMHQMITREAATISAKKVTVIDSRKLSAAQGLLVMKASELIAQGLEHQAVVNKIEDLRENTHFYVAADEFKTMIRSGRVPKILGLFAEWSRIKPILGLNREGKPRIASIAFGANMAKRRLIKKMTNILKQHKTASPSIALVHAAVPEKANLLAKQIFEETGIKIHHIYETSCGIGLHIGKGCVGIAVMAKSF